MAFKKAGLISKFVSKGSFKFNKISKKIFKLNPILKREKPLKRHKKTKSIKKPFNKNKSFLKASVLLIGALGGLSHLRASECRYWSWWSGYHDKIESGSNSPTHNSYCLFSSTQGSGTYYLNTLTTYSAGGASFTQKFNNGTLNVGGNIRFGGTGVNDDTNGGFSFSGNNNNSAISFDKTSFNQGTYNFNSLNKKGSI